MEDPAASPSPADGDVKVVYRPSEGIGSAVDVDDRWPARPATEHPLARRPSDPALGHDAALVALSIGFERSDPRKLLGCLDDAALPLVRALLPLVSECEEESGA